MGLALPAGWGLRDPLVERDVVRLCARPSFFWNRAAGATLASCIALFAYAMAERFGDPDLLGRVVHLQFAWIALIFVKGQALVEGAQAVPLERGAATLPVLLTAPISPRRLASGFLLSRVLFALVAALALLPLEGLALLLGGVGTRDVLLLLAGLLLVAVFGASVGLLGGCGAPDVRRATARAGFLSLTVVLLLPLALGSMGIAARRGDLPLLPDGGQGIAAGLRSLASGALRLTPAALFLHVLGAGALLGSTATTGAILLQTSLSTAGWALLAVLLAGRRLRLETESEAVASARPGTWARIAGWFPGGRSRARPVGRRPLLWKESRPGSGAGARWAPRVAFLALAGFLGFLWFHPRIQRNIPTDGSFWAFDVLLCGIPWLGALVLLAAGATFVAEERERRALDLLRVAPLPIRDYILARPLGALRKAAPILALLGIFGAIGVLRGQVHLLTPIAWLAGTALVYPLLYLLCFRRGMDAPSVRVAGRRAGLPIFLLLFVWPFLVGIAAGYFHWRRPEALFAVNPFCSMVAPLVGYAEFHESDRDAERFALSGCLAALVWAGAGFALWRTLPRRLEEAFHRAEET